MENQFPPPKKTSSFFEKFSFARDKKFALYSVGILLGVILLIVILKFLSKSNEIEEEILPTQISQEQLKESSRQIKTEENLSQDPLQNQEEQNLDISTPNEFYTQPEGELLKIMQKANILYGDGKKKEALKMFEGIALYSQTLANYNLGVIYAGENDFTQAKKMFEMAIEGGDDVALSALNGAYSAFKMKDQKSFNHLLGLASQTLADSARTPFYSYLYALTSFYKDEYFESLSPLLHPNSNNYQKQNDALASEMFLMFGDDYSAMEYLKKDNSLQNALALGMLYARNGDYVKAREKTLEFLEQNPNDLQALSAMELISFKLSDFTAGATSLSSIEKSGKQPYFKIKTGLNQSLFDIDEAQKKFWNNKFESRQSFQYKLLFYYAPYKVFDSKQVFDILAQGGFDAWVGEIDEAQDSYIRGGTISKINREIAKGLREVYGGDIRQGLEILLSSSTTQHPVLYYNIGLLYAQLEDFENAYAYFSKAYYLDDRDLLSGVFAIMTGQLTYQDVSRLTELVAQDFLTADFKNDDQRVFLSELFAYARGGKARALDFTGKDIKSIYLALQAIYAIEEGNLEKIKLYSSRLKELHPKDLATEILYEVSKHYGQNLKKVSLEFSETFRRGGFSDMRSLYYGGSLTRELYIYLAFVTGNLSFAITHLQENLSNQEGSPIGTMQALGLAYIYNQEFEKAFAVYNDLIDNLKENDTKTKFLGAVAAIGAGHHNNAVALLQISKLDSTATLESRYALALLYQQIGNLKSATNLLLSVGNKGFRSEFFDFEIDTSEILQKAIE